MEIKEIQEKLCQYDERNPNNTLEFQKEEYGISKESLEESKLDCACDNCFYGRTKLANCLLQVLEQYNLISI